MIWTTALRSSTRSRALTKNGLAEERSVSQFALHGEGSGQKIVGRVLAKGLAGDEMGERVHLIVDGVDGRVHHIEFKDPSRIEEVGRDMIVEAAPVVSGPRPADRNIAGNAADGDGIYRPSRHLERIHDNFERQGKDPEAFIRSHVRRLEACAGLVIWNGSMPIIERSPRTSFNADRRMTSVRAAMGSEFGPCPPSISRSRSAAMARPGSTGN